MKKIVLILIIVVLIIIIDIFLSSGNVDKISLIKSESYYSEYEIKGDKVYIKCSLTFKNTYKIEKKIKIFASLPDDVDIGLLKNKILYPLDENDNIIEFTVQSNSKQSFDIIFVGEFAGVNKKHDRNLPEIVIESTK